MHKHAFALLVVTIQILPLSLMACDCEYDEVPVGIVHFTDGRSPTSPVPCDHGAGDTEGYNVSFAFRDYGPAHAAPPPAEQLPQHRQRSGS
jgi:hypothetical protein